MKLTNFRTSNTWPKISNLLYNSVIKPIPQNSTFLAVMYVSFSQSFAESLSWKSLVYENCEPLTLTSSRARRHYRIYHMDGSYPAPGQLSDN